MRGLFVTGTGTGVGKTVLSAALIAAMVASGESVRAHKPVLTGLEDQSENGRPSEWPPDHELLAIAAGMTPEDVAPVRYRPAVSPHLAAELAGERLDPARMLAAIRATAEGPAEVPAGTAATTPSAATPVTQSPAVSPGGGTEARTAESFVIVEGVGGLLVPLTDDYTVRDLAMRLGLPLLVAAPPGLGTINHTLLTLQAARAAGLEVCGVVLTPWPERPSTMERSNRETIGRLGAIEVWGLPHLSPDPIALARAGASLPWGRWLSHEVRPAESAVGDRPDAHR